MLVLKIFNSDASQHNFKVILPQDKTNFERGYNPFFTGAQHSCSLQLLSALISDQSFS